MVFVALLPLLTALTGVLPSGQVQEGQTEVSQADRKAEQKHKQDVAEDVKLGNEIAEEVKKEIPTSDNKEYAARVERIGREIATIADHTIVKVLWGDPMLSSFDYQFTVLKGDDVNAFSLPGGHIYVYEGTLKFCESDDELAGVLAHEIAHAAFRHIATLRKEQSKLDVVNIPLILAAIFSKSQDAGNILIGADLLNRAVGSGWSVKAEEAADYGGLQFLLSSKYNPVGMLTFMERLAFQDRGQPSANYSILQTHPPTAERAHALMAHLKEHGIAIKRSEVTTSLRTQVLPGNDGTVELWFGKNKVYTFGGTDALTRADASARAVDDFFDAVPAIYEIRIQDQTKIVGQDRLLLEAAPEDGGDGIQKAALTLEVFKRILFDLNYRLWQNADRAIGSG